MRKKSLATARFALNFVSHFPPITGYLRSAKTFIVFNFAIPHGPGLSPTTSFTFFRTSSYTSLTPGQREPGNCTGNIT